MYRVGIICHSNILTIKPHKYKYWRKEDMKKFISFVMAAVLCVGMTTTVFAANSVDTDAAGGTEGMIE